MKTAKVAIVGFGTIGSGTARLLLENASRIARHAGRPVELARVVDKDLSRGRNVDLPEGILTDDLAAVTGDPEITAAVELVGGLEPARSIVLALLESGKDVITANKALLAEHGPELFDRARQLGRSIAFEASVGGGIPIIAAVGQCLSANRIQSLHAILNGTSNFILTQMAEHESTYADAVAEAQRLGFAEANPAMDVNGSDAAQKLAILAHLAFGARVHWKCIPRIGIDTVEVADLRYAKELGYSIKLLAVAEVTPEGLELHVSPTLVRLSSPLAQVSGAYNAIRVVGDAVGRIFLHGLGAGQMPTASAVVADIIDTIIGRAAITFRTLELWSDSRQAPVTLRDPATVPGRFYLRLNVQDNPGVLAEIAGILGQQSISIASVIQHEMEENHGAEGERTDTARLGIVPLVIMTHTASEGAVTAAMAAINRLASVYPGSIRMRVRN
jgi:homoserine dehydrogenase